MGKAKIRWAREPKKKDFDAAAAYLCLVFPERRARRLVARLKRASTVQMKPKDLERASGETLLPSDDPVVSSKPRKSVRKDPLTPVLLVRGDVAAGRPLLIADGYHRICASYHVDRDAPIPCRIVDVDGAQP